MRQVIAWVMDIIGIAALAFAGYLVHPAVGYAVVGLGAIALARLVEIRGKDKP